ncbi:MAG TPA: hypothetical protein VFE24_11325 [Pirellulales bacterium]|jgi:predicted homoserine dehydrogenase-like protein|nr:hypothetical protein [Pirellulales bacterium]
MMILDTALEKRAAAGRPVRVGLVGAGFMGRAIAQQFLTPLPGLRLVAIAARRAADGQRAWLEAGAQEPLVTDQAGELEQAIAQGRPAVVEDPRMLCEAEAIDVLVEVTGHVEQSAQTVLHAIQFGKHVVLMNAELDATIGPILKVYAERAGVVLTNTDGDEPGVAMNLFRFVKCIGLKPVMAGNIKGFYDPRRNPDTQRGFAEQTKQNVNMVTSFADGTKLSMETTIVANATGLRAGRRGMFGHRCAHVKDVLRHFTPEQLLEQGLVDFVLGAEPGSGAFVVGYGDQPGKAHYLNYFKMGAGPLYVFYTPFHLPHLEVAITVGRAALFQDAAVTPLGAPVCDVVTIAKRPLRSGEILDGIGGFTCYGMIDNAETAARENLLPMGLSGGCRLRRDILQDQPLTYADVDLPPNRLCDQLREEQTAYFAQLERKTSRLVGAAQ